MKRDLPPLSNKHYDLCVIGGGIYGACVAWEAVLRGLSVALVEKNDFASATSANSLKIIHGGLRYLQHADFKRMRESIREQGILMRIAPHLVHPLPVCLPTNGYGLQSRWVYTLALALNDLVGFDRNRSGDPQKKRPRGQVISKQACVRLLPELNKKDLTGGAIFYDAQVYHSERLVLSFLRSAANLGADLANYCEVQGLIQEQDQVVAVEARDRLTREVFPIRSKMIINTSGPWVNALSNLVKGHSPKMKTSFVKAINLVTRPLFKNYAVGLPARGPYRDSDAVIHKGNRLLFAAPWREVSVIGTNYLPYDDVADKFKVTKKEIETFLDEINHVCPNNPLTMKDVLFVHGGLLPSGGFLKAGDDIQLKKHFELYDHQREGIKGMISVVGVKYTTARFVAEKVVDRVGAAMGKKMLSSASAETPLHDGDIEDFESFLASAIQKEAHVFGESSIQRLVYNYGAAYPEVLSYVPERKPSSKGVAADLLEAETLHGIREEMAIKLSDVVFRRTELGTAGHPGSVALKVCGALMAKTFGWSRERLDREYREVESRFLNPGQIDRNGETDVGVDLAPSAIQ